MPQAAFVSLPGLNHVVAFRLSDLVVPLVRDFLTAREVAV